MPCTREEVVAEAKTWIPTPYHVNAAVKGAGVDCARFLYEVYRTCGIIGEETVEIFGEDWWAHASTETYLLRVMRHANRIAQQGVRPTEALPADIVLVKTAGSQRFNHGGLVTRWPRIIQVSVMGVQEVNASTNFLWRDYPIVLLDPFRDDRKMPSAVAGIQPEATTRAVGLGDVVARVASAVGIKPCGGCNKRRAWLNQKVPFNR